jgi:hypothetical protein
VKQRFLAGTQTDEHFDFPMRRRPLVNARTRLLAHAARKVSRAARKL